MERLMKEFGFPPELAKEISEMPLWQRYKDHTLEHPPAYPLVLHLIDDWQQLFSASLNVLESVQNDLITYSIGFGIEELQKAQINEMSRLISTIRSLHALLVYMESDLKEMVEFGRFYLPTDPWVWEGVEEVRETHPEWFADMAAAHQPMEV